MKTIVRVGETIEGRNQIREEKLSGFAVKQLADAFSARRGDFPEGLLIIEAGKDERPVYMVVSNRPPELLAGNREVHAVFWPVDSQEPVATFHDEGDAIAWAEEKHGTHDEDYIVRTIDSTDRVGVQLSIATMIWRGEELLFCRLKGTKQWTFPEGMIRIGESTAGAAQRSVIEGVGLEIRNIRIPARIPYMNTYLRMAGQHFLTVLMCAEYEGGSALPLDPAYDRVEWFSAKEPPKPLFALVAGAIQALEKYGDEAREEAL